MCPYTSISGHRRSAAGTPGSGRSGRPARVLALECRVAQPLPPPALPPLPELQRLLRTTTEFLAHELGAPHAQAPDWSAAEWYAARAMATVHGVSGLLAGTLRWSGPPGWREFLDGQRQAVAARQARIAQLLALIDREARGRGVALVALKGAALQARGIYQPGERPMADVDVLVAEAQLEAASELIRGLGFASGPVTWKHRSFDPPRGSRVHPFGESAGNPLKVELHACARELLPRRAVDITAVVLPGELAPGLHDYPSRPALLLHVLLHAAGAMLGRTARLLHLHDIARLVSPMGPADWEELFRLGGATADPTLWWAYAPLTLTEHYFGCVPAPVLTRLRGANRWLLRRAYRSRRLTDVSISSLWISAFPGIEWSRSAGELAGYVVARVRPSPETVRLRGEFADSQPLVSGGEWARTPQLRRVLRWLRARQPRQESLSVVQAAFAEPLAPPGATAGAAADSRTAAP